MRSDFDKPIEWRRATLNAIRSLVRLIRGGQLTCSYVEMVGLSGIAMFQLMRAMLRSPHQFIGVDNDPCVVFENRRRFLNSPDAPVLALGDFYRYCVTASDPVGTAPQPSAAIFNVDETRRTSESGWWAGRGAQLLTAVARAVREHGESLLILNCSLDRAEKPSKQLISIARELQSNFARWAYDPTSILGRDFVDAARADEWYLGRGEPTWVGGFQIYCSGDATQRMATVRLKFNSEKMTVYRPQ